MRPHQHIGAANFLVWMLLCAALGGCAPATVELFDGSTANLDGGADSAARPDASALSQRDPERCGSAARHCEDDEYCIAGVCVCREALTRLGERCVDRDTDPAHCGPSDLTCPEACSAGRCALDCSGRSSCEGACVDTARDPRHCGECGRPCGSSEVCVGGRCRDFEPVETCAECDDECCSYPTRPTDLICVQHDSC